MLSNCGVGGDFFFFWLCWVFVSVCGLSLVVTSRGYSLIVVHGLLIVVASLVVEHRVQCVPVSVAAALMPLSMWDLHRSGIEPRSPELAGGFLTTRPPGKS